MQRLTYINLNNEQAVFCGAPYVLAKLGGLGLPELEIESIQGAYQQGETAVGCRRQKRRLTLTLHIMADSRAELYRRRMELLNILSPDKAVHDANRAVLIYENDNGRYLTWVIPDGGLDDRSTTTLDGSYERLTDLQKTKSPIFCANQKLSSVFSLHSSK
ncbi:MAG: hypothetical protein EOM14_17085 [Clostridia bacterium]|nr:hypothetical protein [Clostridia bacterium]